MNHTTDTAGRVFKDRAEFEAHRRHRDAILNPPPKKPRFDAVVVTTSGKLLAGKRREEGAVLLIFPDTIPDPFISKATAEELIEGGYCERATPEQIEAFLALQTTNPAEQ